MGSAHMSLWAAGWGWLPPLLNVVLLLVGAFLILLVLIQKGKGGGLAGAFGGAGGASAFGSRAGDTFTRVTMYVAAVWLPLLMIPIRAVQPGSAKGRMDRNAVKPMEQQPVPPGEDDTQ